MRWFIFLLSYSIGFSAVLVEEMNVFAYLLFVLLYLVITDGLAPAFHRSIVIDPLALSYTSVLLFTLLEQTGDWMFVKYVLMMGLLVAYHHLRGKIENLGNEVTPPTDTMLIQMIIMPIICPLASYFVFRMFLPEVFGLFLYSGFYFGVLIYFTRLIQEKRYALYLLGTQLAVVTYLVQFMEPIGLGGKILLYSMVLVSIGVRILYQRIKGEKTHDTNLHAIPRQSVQKPENDSRIHERY